MEVLNIHGVGDVRLDSYLRPQAGPKDVVIKMKAVGICGSDLTYIRIGGINRPENGVTALGHEGAGEVIEVGSEVHGLAVGDPVIVNPMMTPSNIGSGGPEGAFTQELLVRDARLGDSILPIPEGIPYDLAALCEPLAVAMHGVNQADVSPGDKVVIFGCGPIGLGMILWLADRGITDVIALDLSDERLERAKALGARAVVNPSREDVRKRIGELHGVTVDIVGSPAVGTDAYIDAAGGPRIVSDVVNMSKTRAKLVVTAAYTRPVELPIMRMQTCELIMTTACGYPTEMPEVAAAMPRLKDKIAMLISHRLPFENVIEGIGIAGTPQSAKVMIEFA